MNSTQDVYLRIKNQITGDPIEWLEDEIGKRQPIGTLLPKRAVVRHLLISEHGYSEEEADQALPKLKGRKGRIREGLTKDQCEIFLREISRVPNPSRSILYLIYYTGMRISEVCGLDFKNLESKGNRYILRFRGKGDKERLIPLSRTATTLLERYLVEHGFMYSDGTGIMDRGAIFPNSRGFAITPHSVRKHVRKLAKSKGLNNLTPHVLRHTFATSANRIGIDLKTLQSLLGHSNISTTSRYLHPTQDDLIAAIDKMDDL